MTRTVTIGGYPHAHFLGVQNMRMRIFPGIGRFAPLFMHMRILTGFRENAHAHFIDFWENPHAHKHKIQLISIKHMLNIKISRHSLDKIIFKSFYLNIYFNPNIYVSPRSITIFIIVCP